LNKDHFFPENSLMETFPSTTDWRRKFVIVPIDGEKERFWVTGDKRESAVSAVRKALAKSS